MAALAGIILFCLLVPPAHAQNGDGPPLSETVFASTLEAQPPAVSPGETFGYVLTLNNTHEVDYQITISATLPAGFVLSVADLPAGAAYNLRSGILQWTGAVEAKSERVLNFPGVAPVEPRADGRLTLHAALVAEAESENVPTPTANQVTHLSATGWVGRSPSAAFSHILEEQTVRFYSHSEGAGPLSIWWDFGDGTTATEANPEHQYSKGGEYTVRLTVANPMGSSTASEIITVSSEIIEPAPSPYQILIDDDTPAVGQPVYLSNLTEPISVTVLWNFGNGYTSNDLNPIHVFQEPGVFTITQVLGEGAAAIQSFHTVTVDYPPQASIAIDRPTVPIEQLVTFSAQTTPLGALTYFWDFGDGMQASSAAVAHSYDSPGVYPVTLAVSNDFGVTLDTLEIHVTNYTVFLPLVTGDAGAAAAEEPSSEPEAALEPVEEVEVEPVVPMPVEPLAQEILQAINAERTAVGLPPLTWSDQLTRSAQHHTDDMATHWFTGHNGSNGSRPIDRMRQASYTGDYAGECTAWGFDDIASAVAWWMSSPPHRVIILSTVATEIGGAYSHNPNAPSVHYWTIDFGAD